MTIVIIIVEIFLLKTYPIIAFICYNTENNI